MKTVANTSLALLLIAFSLNAYNVLGQPTEPSTPAPAKADKAKKAADFATKEKALQDASRSSASGAGTSNPATEATPLNKDRNAGKGAATAELGLQLRKGSPKVDKTAKPDAPMKDISKMTPKERD